MPFFVLFYGASVADSLVGFLDQIPWLTGFLGVLGGALPAVGIAILLFQIATTNMMLVWFLLGWVLVAFLKMPTVGIAVVGALIAVIYYQFFSKTEAEG